VRAQAPPSGVVQAQNPETHRSLLRSGCPSTVGPHDPIITGATPEWNTYLPLTEIIRYYRSFRIEYIHGLTHTDLYYTYSYASIYCMSTTGHMAIFISIVLLQATCE
jgi:hypothetical protein